MSMLPRCHSCDELVTKCRCEASANPLHRPGWSEKRELERMMWESSPDGRHGRFAA